MIDAAQGASAHRIIAVMPWFGYARQDKKSEPREPISARVVAKCLEADRRRSRADDGPPLRPGPGLLRGSRRPHDRDADAHAVVHGSGVQEGLVIVSPDAGRVKVARNFARKLGVHWAVMEKERPAQQVAEIGYVVGDVRGKTAVLVDDMIDTAGTLCAAANTVRRRGRGAGHRLRHPRRLLRPCLRAPALRELWHRAHRRDRHDPSAPGRPGKYHRPLLGANARRLDPPDLCRRLGLARSSPGENQLF